MPFFCRLVIRHLLVDLMLRSHPHNKPTPHKEPEIGTNSLSMMLRRLIIAALISAIAATVPAQAQAPAPFDGNLQRLAEIMGALHYLRALCGANEGQKWRNEVQALIDAEAPSGDRRTRMVASFNRGYRSFQQTYRTCTPAADLVIRRYLEEGSKIARDVTARYAN
jgi:uncharacterized protein (TIGR02301 family)